jgi:hypothetical protein
MANYIVLRLVPQTAIHEATFTTYLQNLTISALPLNYNDPNGGPAIGSAIFTPPAFPPPAGTQIVQHSTPPLLVLPLLSVATALIEYPVAPPPFVNFLVQIQQGAQTLILPEPYYAVNLFDIPGPFPSPDVIQAIPDADVSAFINLPPPSQLLIASNSGAPPNFDTLLAAVTSILAADPGIAATPAVLSLLTPAQCLNIAKEIVYGPDAPLPTLPDTLGDMFTNPVNTGDVTLPAEENRETFEGLLSAYYGTRDAQATTLAGYIYALAASEWLELQTRAATGALVSFPVNPNGPPPPLATQSQAQLIFTGLLGLDIPAAYFYGLTYNIPTSVDLSHRQSLVFGADPQSNLNALVSAIDAGWIALQPLNPAQAVRILEALNIPASTTVPTWPIANASANAIFETGFATLPTQPSWLGFPTNATWTGYTPADDLPHYWTPLATNYAGPFLDLVLAALTQGFTIGANSLADEIKARLLAASLTNVGQIENAAPADWRNLFAALPALLGVTADAVLPPFTLPGSVAERINAFIAYVQQFFAMGTNPTVLSPVAAEILQRFGMPTYDVIEQTIAHYPMFAFGMTINHTVLENAAGIAALGDERAQQWAVQAVETLNELYILSQILGESAAFDFSVMEALFARGFTSREQVLEFQLDDFTQALTGTIAYDHAAAIYANAGLAPVFPPPPGGTTFGPINPGNLTDCIPPLHLSPLGPVNYLHEMLKVSQRSNCDHPFAAPATNHTRLWAQIAKRRGPVGQLITSRANLETPLPMIDMVNECLEFMASTSPPTTHGTIYDTTERELAGYELCDNHCDCGPDHHDCGCEQQPCGCHGRHDEDPKNDKCHDPIKIFGALPEYSTPATPVGPNSAVAPPLPGNTSVTPAVWEKLKSVFNCCCLPYDQALDVNRTYLEYFRSCRFEEMRTFRKCITELVLGPAEQPADFQSYLWRYPVRIDIAIEYLGLSKEEYLVLFNGALLGPCDAPIRRDPINLAGGGAIAAGAAGLLDCFRGNDRDRSLVCLPEFLKCTCLTYCEFYDLWKSSFVKFSNASVRDGKFPECEPCCLDDLCLRFPAGAPITVWLEKIIVFVRLWLKLRHRCGAGYSFAELADICEVLELSNPDFIRRLAAFQMLRDQFRLPLTGRETPAAGATGADRTFLLALWAGPGAAHWQWAVHRLLEGVAFHAKCQHACEPRKPEFIKLLEANLDPLSALAGFHPKAAGLSWHAWPQHTLRFAEILAKIYASNFSIGEVLYLFHADFHLDGDDPFPLQDQEEALDSPLGLPDDEHGHSLWRLRRKLIGIHVDEEESERWTWPRIAAALTHEFGFPDATVTEFGEHFFPEILEKSGMPPVPGASRFVAKLVGSSAGKWNSPPPGPFQYDAVAERLWAVLPLRDGAALAQLTRIPPLNPAEQQAVQNVYFLPRARLANFAMLFDDFDEAQRHLIEDDNREEAWRFFQRRFALAQARVAMIADHLTEHVEAATGQRHPEGREPASLILKSLFADENEAAAWENNDGVPPPVTWQFTAASPGYGGAFAALLGLAGTGLEGEFAFAENGPVVWREVRDDVTPFGRTANRENCPVPTIIPSMALTLTPNQMAHVTVRNGIAMADQSGQWLGGAQGFHARWHGALLIDDEGEYHFHGGAPGPEDRERRREGTHHGSWRVIVKRGQKTWVLLRHRWHGEDNIDGAPLRLDKGAYEIDVQFVQHSPTFLHGGEVHAQYTGFELKYRGPDTDFRLEPIAPAHLFRQLKHGPLSVPGLGGFPAEFLRRRYASSLRDIRRTYQRAFKALLFAHRFELSAWRHAGEGSELGYILSEAEKFSGWSYFQSGPGFVSHRAYFDFNFLPVGDPYFPPVGDSRAKPSHKRVAALFDWWERIFDYVLARREVHAHCGRRLWLMWLEARDQQPADQAILLRHMGADAAHWRLDLRFFQDQFSAIYHVSADDLEDDRWTVRAWRADLWLRRLWEHFTVKDIAVARPDLWASDDPAQPVGGGGESGNANLLKFLCDGSFDNGEPRRYDDIRKLNDGLRERGRDALICYLCGPQGVAKSAEELSAILLMDVLSGRRETASRIEEAITAVQTFVRRARIGLEPNWAVSGAFVELWDCRFISYRVWQACKRRELYKENWIDWEELKKAKKIEAFGFLDEQLKRATLTIAEPGGVDFWPDHLPPSHPAICLLQRRDPAEMRILPKPREGLDLLATSERDARPSWITMVPEPKRKEANPVAANPVAIPAAPATPALRLPFWLECAIRLGGRFVRVAASAYPPASTPFAPRHECHPKDPTKDKECCVGCCCEECGCERAAHVDEYYFWLIDSKFYTPKSQPVYTGVYDGEQNDYYDQNAQTSTPWHDPTNLAFSNGVSAATSAATAAGATLHFVAAPAGVSVGMFVYDVTNPGALPPGTTVTSIGANVGVSNAVAGGGVASGDTILFATFLYDLLTWPSSPTVRLAWCRVHNGEFEPPRRSTSGVAYDPNLGTPDISFAGRVGDSLYFEVNPPGTAGFRYDLVPDEACELEAFAVPVVPSPPAPPIPLPAYPYFVYFEPGARLFPWSLYSPAIAVAHALRAHCRFEAALKWYELVYNPLSRDNLWALCEEEEPRQPQVPRGEAVAIPVGVAAEPCACCDTTEITCREARDRSLLLHYLDALLEWGDALMRRKSPEAFEQARVVYDVVRKIMGRHPHVVENPLHPHQTVANFEPLWAPINPRLMTLYDQLDDRLTLVHERLTLRRFAEAPQLSDFEYWDDDPTRGGWRTTLRHACCETDGSCRPCLPYRFTFRIERAKELAAQAREMGSALLAAFQSGDAEYLASMRARQEHELAQLSRKVREDSWRDADWQVQALELAKQAQQSNRRYFKQLITKGLNSDEQGYVDQTDVALGERTAANVMEVVAEGMDVVPDLFVGTDDFVWLPLGTKLAGLFKTIARVLNTLGDIANTTASLDLTQGGWARRAQDWNQQVTVLDIQIHQTELQILGAERRRDLALRELNIQERMIEQTKEVLDFMKNTFTSHALYLYLQKHTADLYKRFFELALNEAFEAERAFNFERGYTTREFIGRRQWDNLHEGLLAGERLQLELAHMEKDYFDHNCREYELTKHISLRLSFPMEFLRLKLTGRCDIQLPEWMFDLDYPGQYMRRIKTVSLTIPVVAGPYNEVHCRLTLLRSGTRIDPLPRRPAAKCCDCCQSENGYSVCPHDPRWVSQNGALEAIATSSGLDDSGLFQVSFDDERYLPFEFRGAVSHWRIELPRENNYFNMETLSDVVLNLNYTSREGGDALRRAAREASACDLPGKGWRLFDVRHEFADAWELFRNKDVARRERCLDLELSRRMFPFVPGDRELCIEDVAVLFDRPHECGCECPQECPCCSDPTPAHRELVLRDRHGEHRFECVDSEDWPYFYYGIAPKLGLGPVAGVRERERVSVRFPDTPWPIESVYLLCRYSLHDKCCSTDRDKHERGHRASDSSEIRSTTGNTAGLTRPTSSHRRV